VLFTGYSGLPAFGNGLEINVHRHLFNALTTLFRQVYYISCLNRLTSRNGLSKLFLYLSRPTDVPHLSLFYLFKILSPLHPKLRAEMHTVQDVFQE
jgi:hypothetical protein